MEIKIEKLSKKFGDNHVLKNINILIEKNKSTIILGKSGCGKSVLLKIIYQLIRNDKGFIFYDKKKFVDIDKFGMLFQYGALFDSLTVAENIAFIDFVDGKKNYKNKVINSLKEVGLTADVYDKHPSEISGGMKKRAALARAIYKNPKVIFLDEPTTGLDPINSDMINELIIRIIKKKKMTAITITHDIQSALKTGDNYFFLNNGVVEDFGKCNLMLKSKNKLMNEFLMGVKKLQNS
ncbi:ATP-binding cassette domain-containing protein [Alphaproteobacteria bacterium]|nr:ATP-binding cassette domain-containing protein [Alphaproteobacteria bacterium]